MSTITIDGLLITVPPILTPEAGLTEEKIIDLADYYDRYVATYAEGPRVRMYMDADGTIAINPRQDSWWLLAEVDVPAPSRDEETGEPAPLVLENIKLYDLPEVATSE